MPIETWTLYRAGELVELYNTYIDSLPYVPPFSADALGRAAQTEHEAILENEVLVVGLDGTTPKAFAQIGDLVRKDPEVIPEDCREYYCEGGGLIRMFVSQPRHLKIAQEVLTGVEDLFRKRGKTKIWASDETSYHLYRYATGFGSDFRPYNWLTDYQLHALPLLSANGYDVWQKGICLHLPNYEPTEPTHDAGELQIDSKPQSDVLRPSLDITISRDDKWTAQILISSLELSEPFSSRACYVDGFGTAEQERRKGFGRFAMHVGMSEMHKLGFRHVVLDVLADNYPAQLLYLGMGFQKLSCTFSGKKELT